MFKYVTLAAYEAEKERRIEAETQLKAAHEHAKELLETVQDLIDRSLPRPVPPGFGVVPAPVPGVVTSSEVFKIPAVGKRGIRERNAAAREADLRLEEQAKADQLSQRRASLTAAEQKILDAQIPK